MGSLLFTSWRAFACLAFLFLAFAENTSAQLQCADTDKQTLLNIEGILDPGGTVLDWDIMNPNDGWKGVYFGSNERVRSISLSSTLQGGSLPPEFGCLTELESLNLNNNQLSGTIPSELDALTKLQRLLLQINYLSGAIPSELGTLSTLTSLDLQNNDLSGTIPSELGELTLLKELHLSDNNLTGTIPLELGELTLLDDLYLSVNDLSGTIPSELGELTLLKELHLSGNDLSGTIPPELGALTKLERLHIMLNKLIGTIPAELGALTELISLDISVNKLSGTIPSELGDLTLLSNLGVSINDLSGTIPHFNAAAQIEMLDFSYNSQLTGEFGQVLPHLTRLNIKCTGVSTSPDPDFQTWLNSLGNGFIGSACNLSSLGRVTGVEVTAGVEQLAVSWNTVTGAESYKVQWKSGTEDFNETDRQDTVRGGSTTGYVITRLTAGTPYTVRVIATRPDADDGPPSSGVTDTPSQPLTPNHERLLNQVTGVEVTAGVEQLAVSWNTVTGAESYKVQWKSGTEDFNETDRQDTVRGGSTTGYVITRLTAGTPYTVRVIATRPDADDGPPSSGVTDTPSQPLTPNHERLLNQVTRVEVTAGVEQLTVSWNAVTGAQGYKVQWKSGSEDFNETDRQDTVPEGRTTGHVVTGLAAGTAYTVRVIATGPDVDDGPPSSARTGTPSPPLTPSQLLTPNRVQPLDQVTGVRVTPGVEQLAVSWNAVTGAQGYKVQWKSGAQDFNETARQNTVPEGRRTNHVITGLTAGTAYTVRVIATRPDADDGPPSSARTGIPESLGQASPVDTFTEESGGCAIASGNAVNNTSKRTLSNLFLIVSVLFLTARRTILTGLTCQRGNQTAQRARNLPAPPDRL